MTPVVWFEVRWRVQVNPGRRPRGMVFGSEDDAREFYDGHVLNDRLVIVKVTEEELT